MAENIKGQRDGKGGKNDSYKIPGRGVVSREKLVNEIESGRHSDFSVYERNGEKYVRRNPDNSSQNNVND